MRAPTVAIVLVSAAHATTAEPENAARKLREALLSASEVQHAQVLSQGPQSWQVLFDADTLHESFPDPLGRDARQRLGDLLNSVSSRRFVSPAALFDVAFAGSNEQHSQAQQDLQALPSLAHAPLRLECSQSALSLPP